MSKRKLHLGTAMALTLGASSAQAGTLYYSVMNNANEPQTATLKASPATGQGWLILNDAETSASVYVLHNEATVNAANPITIGHIHRGPAGIAGPVIFPFPTPPTSPVGPLTWAIPTADVANLKAGGLYTQIHNSANPSGDIRGQLNRVRFVSAATSASQTALANVLDISAGLNSDLDTLLMQEAAATPTAQATALDELSGRTLYVQSAQALDSMAGFEDSLFGHAAEANTGTGNFGMFIKGGDAFGKRDTGSDQAGSKISRPFLMGGVEYGAADNLVIGAALGYADASDKFDGGLGKTDTKTTAGMIYVSAASDILLAQASAGYGWNKFDTTRNLTSLGRVATSSHDGKSWSLGAKISMPYKLDSVTLSPYAMVDYQNTKVDGYTETGASSVDLVVPSYADKDFAAELGGMLQAPLGGAFAAHLEAGWHQSLDKGGRRIAATFSGAPTPFNTSVLGRSPSAIHLGAALSTSFSGSLSAEAGYHGYISGRMSTHIIDARVTLHL